MNNKHSFIQNLKKEISIVLAIYVASFIGFLIFFFITSHKINYLGSALAAAGVAVFIWGIIAMHRRNKAEFKATQPEKYKQNEEIRKAARSDARRAFQMKLKQITPEKAEKYIKQAWIAGLVAIGITLIVESRVILVHGFNAYLLIVIIAELLILGLMVLGVYLRNKYTAISLFVYYLFFTISIIVATRRFVGWTNLLFLYFFYQGIIGIIRQQQLTGSSTRQQKEAMLVYAIVVDVLAIAFFGLNVILFIGY